MSSIVNKWLRLHVHENDLQKLIDSIDISFFHDYLTHAEEKKHLVRDQWGNWDIQYNLKNHRIPFLDLAIKNKLKELNIRSRSIWPEQKKFSVVFSHDMDVVSAGDPAQIVRRLNRVLPTHNGKLQKGIVKLKAFRYFLLNKFSNYRIDALWHYQDWIEEAKILGIKNTFFVFVLPDSEQIHLFDCDYDLNDQICFRDKKMSVTEFLKELIKEGVEIGLHGSYNSYNDQVLFQKLKEKLERSIGKKIEVTRQHFLKFDINSTLQVHSKNGILVDSTLGYNRGVGFRAGTSYPYFLENGVLEVPQIIMDGSLFLKNSLELNDSHAKIVISNLFDAVAETGGCLTLNFHPHYINVPSYWNAYKFALAEAKRRNAWSANYKEIHELVNSLLNE